MEKQVEMAALMFQKGKTGRALAKDTGIQRQYISMGLHGRYNFDANQKQRIAKALNVPVTRIFKE